MLITDGLGGSVRSGQVLVGAASVLSSPGCWTAMGRRIRLPALSGARIRQPDVGVGLA